MTSSPPPGAVLELVPARADAGVLDSIMAETGVDTTIPGPSVAAYLEAVGERILEAILDLVAPTPAAASLLVGLAKWAALTVVAVAAGLLLFRLVRFVLRGRGGAATGHRDDVVVEESRHTAPARDATAWWNAFEEARLAGRVADALHALWWWFARSLAGESVDDSWTNHDLRRRSGAPGLGDALRRFDLLVYGPSEPTIDDVTGFGDDLLRLVVPDTEPAPR